MSWVSVAPAAAIAPGDFATVELDPRLRRRLQRRRRVLRHRRRLHPRRRRARGRRAGGPPGDLPAPRRAFLPAHRRGAHAARLRARAALRDAGDGRPGRGGGRAVKRLTLVRHAKSDWSLAGQADWDRPLNKRGQRDAPEMARRLRSRRHKPDLILSSPAVRALTTATVMARELKVPAAHPAAGRAPLPRLARRPPGGDPRARRHGEARHGVRPQPGPHRVRQPPLRGRAHRQPADLRRVHGTLRSRRLEPRSTGAAARRPSSTTRRTIPSRDRAPGSTRP